MPGGKKTKHARKPAGGKHGGSGKHAQPRITHAHVVAKHPNHVTPAAAKAGR